MARLSAERRWCLSWWSQGGWSLGRPLSRGIKKWERHIAALTKAGLLEVDGYDMRRITPAGRLAMEQSSRDGGGDV